MALFTIRSREIKLWRVAVLFLCTSALIVFGLMLYARLHRPRSSQLRSGMTMQEVCKIMGDPASTFHDNERENWWYRGGETIELDFRDGRLFAAYAGKGYHLTDDPKNDVEPTRQSQ